MISIVVVCGFLFPDAQPKRPAPLKTEQVAKIRTLLQKIRDRDAALKKQLAERQRALQEAYANFQLDEQRVSTLRKSVIETQTELLSNYHELQVELRKIVGQERFVFLKRRIDNALNSKSKKKTGRAKRSPPKNSTRQ